MRINTHILSLMSQRTLSQTTKAFARAMQRLASGQRINSARDDAAGMALGTGLESQRRGMLQAVRNMNDSRGFLSTAEGALAAQTELIQRMRELALQSANGTLSDTERGYLNTELQQLVEEFDRIAIQSEFNGVKLLDGNFATTSLQVGTQKGQMISFNLASTRVPDIFEATTSSTTTTPLGTFTQATGFSAQDLVQDVNTGDINGDGNADLVLVSVGGDITMKLGNGDGSFSHKQTIHYSNTYSGTLNDFNGDGKIDLASSVNTGTHQLAVLLGVGDGTFTQTLTIALTTSTRVESIDLNGDSKIDLVAADRAEGNLSVWLGNGNGTFETRTTYAAGTNPRNVEFADINSDGILDLVSSDESTAWVSTFIGNGNGTFQSRVTVSTTTGGTMVKTGDVNGDNKIDLLVATNAGSNLYLALGNGNGTFQAVSPFANTSASDDINLFDINGDENLDIIGVGGSFVYYRYGNGNGTFQTRTTMSVGNGPARVAIADWNNDDILDLAVPANSIAGSTQIFMGDGVGMGTTISIDESDLEISSQSSAQNSLNLIDAAFAYLNSARSNIGAIQSRLDYAENNALNLIENISAARSQLMDADFAVETAEFTRLQILQKAGLSVMGQANLNLRLVLSLL